MTISNRNALRAMTRANHAPRTRGQFAALPPLDWERENPNSSYWQQQHQAAKDARPSELRGDPWNTLVDLIWPGDEMMPWKEATLKIRKATELWLAGEHDLPTLAAAVNAAYR